jgi:hypothetical protein
MFWLITCGIFGALEKFYNNNDAPRAKLILLTFDRQNLLAGFKNIFEFEIVPTDEYGIVENFNITPLHNQRIFDIFYRSVSLTQNMNHNNPNFINFLKEVLQQSQNETSQVTYTIYPQFVTGFDFYKRIYYIKKLLYENRNRYYNGIVTRELFQKLLNTGLPDNDNSLMDLRYYTIEIRGNNMEIDAGVNAEGNTVMANP